MADMGWTARVAAAAGASAGTGAAQLGLGYGLGVVVWPLTDTPDDSVWLGSLGWATWITASATVLGAVIASRIGGGPRPRTPESARLSGPWRLSLAAAAAIGALVAVALIALPARSAVRDDTFSPQVIAAGYALVGVVLGLVVAYWAVVSRPVAANLITTGLWLWALAISAVVVELAAHRASATYLTSWQFTGRTGHLYGTIFWPSAALTLAAAFAIGVISVAPAARRGHVGLGAATSGAVGPLLVAAAFFVLAPQLTGALGPLESAYLIAPYAVIAGLAGSALTVTMAKARQTRRAATLAPSHPALPAPPSPGSDPAPAARTPHPRTAADPRNTPDAPVPADSHPGPANSHPGPANSDLGSAGSDPDSAGTDHRSAEKASRPADRKGFRLARSKGEPRQSPANSDVSRPSGDGSAQTSASPTSDNPGKIMPDEPRPTGRRGFRLTRSKDSLPGTSAEPVPTDSDQARSPNSDQRGATSPVRSGKRGPDEAGLAATGVATNPAADPATLPPPPGKEKSKFSRFFFGRKAPAQPTVDDNSDTTEVLATSGDRAIGQTTAKSTPSGRAARKVEPTSTSGSATGPAAASPKSAAAARSAEPPTPAAGSPSRPAPTPAGASSAPRTAPPSRSDPPAADPSPTNAPPLAPSPVNPPTAKPSPVSPPPAKPSSVSPPPAKPSSVSPPPANPSQAKPSPANSPAARPSPANPPATRASSANPPTTTPSPVGPSTVKPTPGNSPTASPSSGKSPAGRPSPRPVRPVPAGESESRSADIDPSNFGAADPEIAAAARPRGRAKKATPAPKAPETGKAPQSTITPPPANPTVARINPKPEDD
ncbi:hypothetical protein ACIA5C_34740 [Actinoplanes sp. NPDC051343]|uniref:hypothetical protein n=1 Tax=Actinoplanes sp. NPDC051343 TaxID=3363906 RepID=UPI003794447F